MWTGPKPILSCGEKMRNQIAKPETSYGGQWTIQKLEILEKYLDAYTTALKKTPFKLMYIDAFAGTGYVNLGESEDKGAGGFFLLGGGEGEDAQSFIRGSAMRAIDIEDRPFDKLIFVEKDRDRHRELKRLKKQHPDRKIRVKNSEANKYLRNLEKDWNKWRGVLFLDPFATEVEWSTLETIAGFQALDTWILFPVYAISRLLPTSQRPEDIAPGRAERLTKVFGDESWRELYHEHEGFFHTYHTRDPGVGGLLKIYKKKLTALFGKRFLQQSRTLRNSKNAALFEFLFCVGSERGIGPAKSIAKHILERL